MKTSKPLTPLINSIYIAENDLRQSFKSVRHVVWSLLFPIFMMFTFSFRYGAVGPDVQFINFLIPGIVGMTAMFGSINETMSIVWDKTLGVFDRILAAPVSSISIIVGKTMAGAVMGVMSALVLLLIGNLLFGVSFANIGLVLLVIALASFSFTGIGTIISGLASEPREAMMLSNLLRFPMMFLGGVFFPIEAMPMPLPYVARAFPLTYATEGLRAVMSGNMVGVSIDAIVLVAYTLGTMLVGSTALMKIMTR
ncbi:MAG: ABC transporter permease [Candidatus Bathyarchaeota archaeon]|nr:ABC transporter permease [Candidatus Bathyarchaeota archaeon]